ncbi:hypothetical protein B296_00020363 [Ensete ventricosum]|uniref:Uncharacterized protein n=1 Tax=Ensete ventricosum TaxID=4639 RepID=A0A427AGE8_ENSVE|nr:hypothetical protein B296_00020363 [Ensete ventricosum]
MSRTTMRNPERGSHALTRLMVHLRDIRRAHGGRLSAIHESHLASDREEILGAIIDQHDVGGGGRRRRSRRRLNSTAYLLRDSCSSRIGHKARLQLALAATGPRPPVLEPAEDVGVSHRAELLEKPSDPRGLVLGRVYHATVEDRFQYEDLLGLRRPPGAHGPGDDAVGSRYLQAGAVAVASVTVFHGRSGLQLEGRRRKPKSLGAVMRRKRDASSVHMHKILWMVYDEFVQSISGMISNVSNLQALIRINV